MSQGYGTGYLDGPAKGAMFQGSNLTADAENNLYHMDEARLRVIDRNGRVWTVAGNGTRGFRDGPADEAMFNVGGRGYNTCNIGVDLKGSIYIPDGHNNRITKIFRKADGEWWVETLVGGGTTQLKSGQTGRALDIVIANPVSLAVDAYGNTWTVGWGSIYKITAEGVAFAYENRAGNTVYMQAEKQVNVHLLVCEKWVSHYWKVRQDGTMERISGMTEKEVKELKKKNIPHLVDGPTLSATFWSHSTFGVSSDGTTIYGGNGDEQVV